MPSIYIPKSNVFILTVFFTGDIDFASFFVKHRLFGQVERCPSTNRLHLQCVWSPRETYSSIRSARAAALSIFQPPAFSSPHIEPAKCPKAAFAYCSKTDTRVSGPFGSDYPRDTKPDRPDPVAFFRAGGSILEFVTKYPPYAYRVQSLTALFALIPRPPSQDRITRTVVLVYGPAGTGKSRFSTLWPLPRFCIRRPPYLPMDYTRGCSLIVDDQQHLTTDGGKLDFLLAIMDIYVQPIRILYGQVNLEHSNVIITSNCLNPRDIVRELPMDRQQAFLRRLTHVCHVPTLFTYKLEVAAF